MWDWLKSNAALLLVVAGWYATHRLTLRAQRQNLLLQATDRARLEIVKALRAYEHWLSRFRSEFRAASSAARGGGDWYGAIERVDVLLAGHREANEWILRLEEYEVLFPDTRDIREQLIEQARSIHSFLINARGQLKKADSLDESEMYDSRALASGAALSGGAP